MTAKKRLNNNDNACTAMYV